MSFSSFAPLLDHLWQSTLFAMVTGLLTLAFRKNRARTRYWLWLAASLKFLLPFSLLMAIGSHIEWRATTTSVPALLEGPSPVRQIARPFAGPAASTGNPPTHPTAAPDFIPFLLVAIWLAGSLALLFSSARHWRRIRLAQRQSTRLNSSLPIEVLSSPTLFEPAVFGIFKPVLLLPQDITSRLTPAQLQAVFAHELCHARYRDNLSAALHMLVEILFWFHPLVWWVGARLIDERERACDEAVLESGFEPETYGESILAVCKLYLASPASYAAGVSGAKLEKRIERIMQADIGRRLGSAGKSLLAIAGTLALAAPLVVGLVNAPPKLIPQSVEPSSVTLSISRKTIVLGFANQASWDDAPGLLVVDNASLRTFIESAYHLPDYEIVGGPSWIDAHQYRVTAKARGNQFLHHWQSSIFQSLLRHKFKFESHREARELPI